LRDESPQRSFKIQVLVSGCLLWIALVITTTEFIQYSRNVLSLNDRWVSSKLLMQMAPMGAYHFVLTRNALQRNQLSLGAWHGFNEVHLNQPVQPAEIDYRFRLASHAYIYFVFNRGVEGHDGIRLSRNERFPSMLYDADRMNRFLARTSLMLPANALSDGWHELRLSFEHQDIIASLDGSFLVSVPASKDSQIIGLRGGYFSSDVDSVRIVGLDGKNLLDESFRNRQRYRTIMAVVALMTLMPIMICAIPFFRRQYSSQIKRTVFRCLLTMAVALTILSMIFSFDYFVWSSRYLYVGYQPGAARPHPVAVRVEALRARLFQASADLADVAQVKAVPVRKEIRQTITAWNGSGGGEVANVARYNAQDTVPKSLSNQELRRLPEKTVGTIRVAFLGTSQTYGEGAETGATTFVARCHSLVAGRLENDLLETYNFSVEGSNSNQLLKEYLESWRFVRSDLLIVNLSNNDSDAASLSVNLRTLVNDVRSMHAQIVFVLEPNSIEGNLVHLKSNHAAIRKLGEELGVPVWDLHGYLSSEAVYDSGMLWWDSVHLTNYGQSLTARWLADQIKPLLKASKSS
jgi:lysophospholipase L1-like esterase